MATTKEVAPKKKKSISAPASPPKLEQPHRRSRTVPDAHHGDISKKITDQQPSPRYLKPTISSGHDTNCHYPKHQQAAPKPSAADPVAGRRLTVRKPTAVDKAHSPTSATQKASASAANSKERTARTTASASCTAKTTATSARSSLEKATSKTPAAAAKTLPIRKTKSLPKLCQKSKEPINAAASNTNVEKAVELDAVSPIAVGSEHQVAHEHPSKPSEIKDNKSKQETEKEQEVDGDKVAAGERLKFKERERNEAEAVVKVEAKSLVFKKQEGSSGGRKETAPAPASNAVIEEAANKLASRKSKVRALAGAFETVISLQKPESHSSQQQEEAAPAPAPAPAPGKSGASGGGGGKDEQQERQELKNGGDGSHNVPESADAGQQSQQGTEKSNDGQCDVEMEPIEEPTIESTNEHEQV